MAKRLASTFIAVAKTGVPDNDQIPKWPAYDAKTRATMVFDANTRVENDPRSAIRKYWSQTLSQPRPKTGGRTSGLQSGTVWATLPGTTDERLMAVPGVVQPNRPPCRPGRRIPAQCASGVAHRLLEEAT